MSSIDENVNAFDRLSEAKPRRRGLHEIMRLIEELNSIKSGYKPFFQPLGSWSWILAPPPQAPYIPPSGLYR